jgi:hypothetical protein
MVMTDPDMTPEQKAEHLRAMRERVRDRVSKLLPRDRVRDRVSKLLPRDRKEPVRARGPAPPDSKSPARRKAGQPAAKPE